MFRSPVDRQPAASWEPAGGRSKLLTLAFGSLGSGLIRCCSARSVVPLPGVSLADRRAAWVCVVCLAFMQPLGYFTFQPHLLEPTRIPSNANFGTQAVSNKGTPAP